jgi:hypothetical protein
MREYNHKVLFQDGFFRIVDPIEDIGASLFIQHEHTTSMIVEDTWGSQGKWSYCWQDIRACRRCATKVPKEMLGFLKLLGWDNE